VGAGARADHHPVGSLGRQLSVPAPGRAPERHLLHPLAPDLLRPQAGDGITATYELRLGDDTFRATLDHGQFKIARGSAEQPDATLEADPVTLFELIYDGRDFAKALRSGALTVQGDKSAAKTFLTLFSPPEPTPRR
jgi:alkyl sulfatase BDS1-like metallo-beta-lactamase superfamily hydrolase